MGKVLGKKRRKYAHLMGGAVLLLSTSLFYATAQYYKSELKAPSPSQTVAPKDDNSSKKQESMKDKDIVTVEDTKYKNLTINNACCSIIKPIV